MWKQVVTNGNRIYAEYHRIDFFGHTTSDFLIVFFCIVRLVLVRVLLVGVGGLSVKKHEKKSTGYVSKNFHALTPC